MCVWKRNTHARAHVPGAQELCRGQNDYGEEGGRDEDGIGERMAGKKIGREPDQEG